VTGRRTPSGLHDEDVLVGHRLATERLVIRPWGRADLPAAREWHADADVMRHLGGPLDAAASDATVRRWSGEWDDDGVGMLAVCTADGDHTIGAVGLGRPDFDSHFTPCIEIGWRFARPAWGRGFASEAATAVLRDGFERLGLAEIVAFAAEDNIASHRVMARIGMRHDVDGGFCRPATHHRPATTHVLWRMRADDLGGPNE
jgi:RimJ/RimL family protein N-acetyltransferase